MNELITFSNGTIPTFPVDIQDRLKSFLEEDFAGLSGSGYRILRPRKADFLMLEGGSQEVIYGNELAGVLIAASPYNHCIWYSKEFAPGQEPEAPDLIWEQKVDGVFPDALPEQYRRKIVRQGQERWAFQIRRRTVWARVLPTQDGNMTLDLERPFILDLTSMSLYGKGNPQQNAYTFRGLREICSRYSVPGGTVTPSMFVCQIMPDPNSSVSGVVVFRPRLDARGNLMFMDSDTIVNVFNTRTSDTVQDMLKVREKLDWTPTGQPTPQVQSRPQPQVMPSAPSASDLLSQAQAALNKAPASRPQVVSPIPQPSPVTPPQVGGESNLSDAFSDLLSNM